MEESSRDVQMRMHRLPFDWRIGTQRWPVDGADLLHDELRLLLNVLDDQHSWHAETKGIDWRSMSIDQKIDRVTVERSDSVGSHDCPNQLWYVQLHETRHATGS